MSWTETMVLMVESAVACRGHPGAGGETHLKTSLFFKKSKKLTPFLDPQLTKDWRIHFSNDPTNLF